MKALKFAAVGFLAALAGCSAYLPNYQYVPHPGVVTVPTTQPSEPPAVTVLATVVGVRRGDDFKKIPEAVEVRLHIDNGKQETVFDPASLTLLSGTLFPFGPVEAAPRGPITFAPGASYDVVAVFPMLPAFKTDSMDMSGLHLRGKMTVGGRPVDVGITFQRMMAIFVEEEPHVFVGGVFHRRW